MKSISLAAAACVALASTAAAQAVFYVDQVNGSNATGNGTAASPFQTMTFAVSLSVPSQSLTLRLQPGVYSAANGESFPLDLPANVTVEGVLRRGARIRHQLANPLVGAATAALRVEYGSDGGSCTMRNLAFGGNQKAVRVRSNSNDTSTFNVENVTTRMVGPTSQNAGIGLTVVCDEGNVLCNIDGATSTDRQIGLWLRTSGFGNIYGTMNSSTFLAEGAAALPSGTAVRFESNGDGEIEFVTNNTAIYEKSKAFEVRQLGQTNQFLAMNHCAFSDNGLPAFIPSGPIVIGGVIDHVIGAPTTCTVGACAFFGNAAELPGYDPNTYSVGDCIVQSAPLVALPGNLTGDPLWVDAANGDFHILPGSPARDAILASLDTDFDGDDRNQGCANAGDIGIDESFDSDIYLPGGSAASLGSTVATNLYGDGGSIAVVAAGIASGLPCGQPQILLTNYVQLGTVTMPGTAGTRAFGTLSFGLPTSTALIGNSYDISAGFVLNPTGIPSLVSAANARNLQIIN
ncbi:MAG: DUF1565 domain-containing protein [Planctomycetota bacterium]